MKPYLSIEDLILEILRNGPLDIEQIIEQVARKRTGTTRQGTYRTLRVLKKREVLTIHSKKVSLSAIWISKMQNYFTLATHYYSQPTNDSGFLNLREGEKVSYSFRSMLELDIFWSHALYLFLEVLKNNQPVYVYNPHDWAYFVRKENDHTLVEKSFETNRQIFVAVGDNKTLDKLVQRNFDGTRGQYYLLDHKLEPKENYYVNIIDDYCIEGFIDQKTTRILEDFYNQAADSNPNTLNKLQKIIEGKGKHRLVISRNKKKVDKIKKMLGKYFYVKKTE